MKKEAKTGLRCIRKRTVEDVIEATSEHEPLNLEVPNICGKDYTVQVTNIEGRFIIDFNEGDYSIIIKDGKIGFKRTLYRPNHDHNDSQTLQISIDADKSGIEKGKIEWRSRFPYIGEGWEFYEVDFGAEKTNY